MEPFRSECLANGLSVAFFDLTNRYFGDYHRVCVEVRMTLAFAGDELQQDPLSTVKSLERMAVPGAEVASVRERLVDDYWRHACTYLAHPAYPARLAESIKASTRRHSRPLNRC